MDDNRHPSWPPFQPSTDCSQGYCSIYCPQWCYFLFPPPPPNNLSGNPGSGQSLSPFVIALIALASAAVIIIACYIIYLYCQRRHHHPATGHPSTATATAASTATTGLDDALIGKITVCRYRRGDGLIGGTNCSVCLSEFQDDETLRLLPKCSHAFHVPCIDTWLKSHPNCPLCRAGIIWVSPPPAATVGSEGNRPMTESEHTHEVEVVVLQDSGTSLGHNEDASKNGEGSREEDGATPMNGSLSVDRSPSIDHGRGSSGALLPI